MNIPKEIKPIPIAPSSVSFIPDCEADIWNNYHGVKPPQGIPLPAIFTQIDGHNKSFYTDKNIQEISPTLPSGVLGFGDMWVKSEVIRIPGYPPFYFLGKLDILGTFDDEAEGYAVIDFKTSNPKVEHLEKYERQLGSYAICLDRPAKGNLRCTPVSHVGILCLSPSKMCASPTGKIGYIVEPTYVPMARDDDKLLEFVAERILRVLALPSAPPPDPDCRVCEYRDAILRGL